MASIAIPRQQEGNAQTTHTHSMTMPDAAKLLSREERFMATVAAMNTLLIEKRIYTQQEFDSIFVGWAKAQLSKPRGQRTGWRPKFFSYFGL